MNYLEIITKRWNEFNEFFHPEVRSKMEWIADEIFDFQTDDPEISEELAYDALEVLRAITEGRCYEYHGSGENKVRYKNFLLMINMPFFATRTSCGTSIRGSFWYELTLPTSLNGNQVIPVELSIEEWYKFCQALLEFVGVQCSNINQEEKALAAKAGGDYWKYVALNFTPKVPTPHIPLVIHPENFNYYDPTTRNH